MRAAKRKAIADEQQRVDDLLRDAENWKRSQVLREYINAVRQVCATVEEAIAPGSELAQWLDWAEAQAARLDPLVDGPPSTTGPLARFPAVPLLKERFAERCLILMDDMQRPSDLDTAAQWEPLLTDFDYRLETAYEKHLGVFSRG